VRATAVLVDESDLVVRFETVHGVVGVEEGELGRVLKRVKESVLKEEEGDEGEVPSSPPHRAF
jgi:hypothetical protein